ncbi:5-formyltetrahydrofolate cyclo-ligase [Thermoactinomyces sp. AMNI-1]|uniref:5-formyltetrahydrofolate cyclo-ligase n=2 Tax=Thermoactinomyces mirandus TaxID=2756294 RepID=A0A7W1XRC2_9BACL|nr:5-formyltetrahydrofolate cyclo-ligase [Thermoactinomyces mirandus]
MLKSELRKSMTDFLKGLSEREKREVEKKLLKNLLSSSLWNDAKTIGVTVSRGFEWNTMPIIESGWEQGKTICVPKCVPKEKKLVFYELSDFGQLEKSYYNLLEPKTEKTRKVEKSKIDLLIVPGLVFDHHGYRIGFGGGYYDRFLADFPNKTLSLAHTSQIREDLPIDSHDIPVQHLITETGKFM